MEGQGGDLQPVKKQLERALIVDPWRGYKWMLLSSATPGTAHAWTKMHGLLQLKVIRIHPNRPAETRRYLMYNDVPTQVGWRVSN